MGNNERRGMSMDAEILDKSGEHTSNAAPAIAPATEGASLTIIPISETVSNFLGLNL